MGKAKKIVFIIPTLEIGGAQRVLSIVLQNLRVDQFDLTLCVMTGEGDFYHDVPDAIKKINLNASRVRYATWKVYKTLRALNPDLVFVFDVNHLNLIVALASLFLPKKIKYISRQAVVLTAFIKDFGGFKFLRRMLYKITFDRFDLIVAQSEYMKKDLIQFFEVDEKKIRLINNPIMPTIIAKAQSDAQLFQKDKINILAVGRMVYVKGYDLLVKAMSLVKNPNVHLTIIGDETPENPGYGQLVRNLVNENNLGNKVTFLGFAKNPYQYINQCSAVAISSRAEAFPNVAIETNALGVPVLAFNCPGGVSEILIEGFNGWLIENGNVEAFAKAIDNVEFCKLDVDKISKYTLEKYNAVKIVTGYEDLIMKELAMN